MKGVDDGIFISNLTWCVIQTVVLLIGYVLAWFLGTILACVTGLFDIPVYCCLLWIVISIRIKFWAEEKFSGYIDYE